jgi:pimeloyl-ACP methyl ester carboxylesterase
MAYPAVFLPGILMPASARYALLRSVLTDMRSTITKELEVYATPQPPPSYSVKAEVDGLSRFADDHALERFHLYGHSAGGAIALAYVAEHTDRVVSLAVDEPASDFSDEDRQAIEVSLPEAIDILPVPERMALSRGALCGTVSSCPRRNRRQSILRWRSVLPVLWRSAVRWPNTGLTVTRCERSRGLCITAMAASATSGGKLWRRGSSVNSTTAQSSGSTVSTT